ncbi:general transcription factor IIH subunit 3 [Spatholobus suberectus]|nr:general transcription factor IIH subunit 3 [Spatholobus suberectus]
MRSVEVAKTVLEVADVAWTAVEHTHHYHRRRNHPVAGDNDCPSDQDLESLRSENRRLRNLLDQNLKLLQNLSDSPCFDNCPPDLNDQLVATMRSDEYLTRLKFLQQETASDGNQFPFKEATELDYRSADILVNVDSQEPSWWVWVTDEMDPSNVEELSGIDDENYLVISEEHVVDGVANFMARCILSNPKALNLSPEELQKALSKALQGTSKLEKILDIWHAGKLFYALSTWGLALAGLYQSRALLRIAAKGVHSGSKLALKAL